MPPQNSSERLNLPGFGLPIDYEPDRDKMISCFLHALWEGMSFESDGLTLREIRSKLHQV